MTIVKYSYEPDYAVHPGEILGETLEARGIKKSEFAERCGLSVKTVSQIINKKAPVTADSAVQFERVLGTSAAIWNNLNAAFELFMAKNNDAIKLAREVAWAKRFPLKELMKRNLISRVSTTAELVKELLDFFGEGSVESWEKRYNRFSVAFRHSPSFKSSAEALFSWLRIGQRAMEKDDCSAYNEENFKSVLSEIRALTRKAPSQFVSEMRKKCAKSGVLILFIDELPGTHVSGATQWPYFNKALIMLSLRYKTDDHLWFSFFHEAGHILLHSRKRTFIDEMEIEMNDLEKEADLFARNLLIPPKDYDNFKNKLNFSKIAITQFAKEIDIAPGIIVGRLQHDNLIPYSWHNSLKRKFRLVDSNKKGEYL